MGNVAFSSWNGRVIDNRKGVKKSAANVAIPVFPGKEKAAALMGWNGIIAKDKTADIPSLTVAYLKAARAISCGECSVCMIGIDRLLDLVRGMAKGKGGKETLDEAKTLVAHVAENSKCGFGQSALFPIGDALIYYKDDFLALLSGTRKLDETTREAAVTAPCMNACPAGLDIPGYIELIKNGRFRESLALVRERCILPGVIGRVCTHPCEDACVRKDMDEPLAIRLLKRAAADFDLAGGASALPAPADIKDVKVAVVGAGPAGLAAAYKLRLMGYGVTVFETLPHAGGMAVVGIPDYRLPADILEHEVTLIRRTGVEMRLNAKVDALNFKALQKEGYKALFIAVGAHRGNAMGIEGEDKGYDGYVDGVDLLRDINLGKTVTPKHKVVIVGGGNVAVDCARSCRRIGFRDVEILYRRSRAEMPASDEEIEGALEEGITIRYLAAPVKVLAKAGRVTGVECIRMKLGKPDESGRRRPEPVKGSEFTVKTDVVIAAIGQNPAIPAIDEKIGVTKWGTVKVDPATLMTNIPGIFAGGDCVSGPATLIEALDMGNRAAKRIDSFIRGNALPAEPSFADVDLKGQRGKGFVVNTPATGVAFTDVKERVRHFGEIEGGYEPAKAMDEARRCLRCYRVVVWG